MPTIRPLPSRPSLEHARKEAKTLVRRLRAGEADALARAADCHVHPDRSAAGARLADAQLTIAREHGFASWPRLARYLDDLERQQQAYAELHGGRPAFESSVRALLGAPNGRPIWSARAVSAYVPRFYGMPLGAAREATVTEAEARLAVARMHGAPSWEVLGERLERNARTRPGKWESDPMPRVAEMMAARDLVALEGLVAAHPELVLPSDGDIVTGRTLMWMALCQERKQGAIALQPIMSWLGARGFDRDAELRARLIGHVFMRPAEVRDLLALGADPASAAPNGIPLLEHALLRYWNGDAVDVLAARVVPRKALWIAAGLGDVDGVRRLLDRQGKPTPAARRLRPDFLAVGAPGAMPALPDADDEELLVEARLVALVNGRTAVLDHLAAHGAPLNSLIYGMPLISIAVGNLMTAAVACLVRCGADLDLRLRDSDQTPRELARELFEQMPEEPERRRIAMICGLDPDRVLAARDARSAGARPATSLALQKALDLAREDAARQGQPDVRPENLLIGLARGGGPPLEMLKQAGRMDVEGFRADLGERLDDGDAGGRSGPALGIRAESALDAAARLAAARRHDEVDGVHLLHALTSGDDGAVGDLLARYGVNAAALNAILERWL